MLADVVVLLHAGFVAFVVLGGFLVLRWRRVAWVHLPAAAWGALIELWGGVCPLTPLENWLRSQGGATPYAGGFVERYVVPVLYPAVLTRTVAIALGVFVLAVNGLVYWRVFRRR
jgi:hypothetical protein